DGSSFVYRSFFALPPLSTSKGFPTNAIYGFLRMIFSLLKKERPQYLIVVFDAPAKTKREKIYADYKKQRPKAPDPLKVQIPVIKEILKLAGIPLLEVPGYEADDVIAFLAKKFSEKSFKVKIYSPDKDLLQLVSEKILVINPMNNEVFTKEKVFKKFGVEPEKIPDYLALVGDKVDNVPGIEGVGPKTAINILKKYGSVENILKNWEKFKKEFPKAERESLELSYKLVKLYTDLNLSVSEGDLKIKQADLKKLKQKLQELEMKSLLREVDKVFRQVSQRSLF
ncbi:MAG: 5'-3' exonuclease, partial [Aquifex sp.]